MAAIAKEATSSIAELQTEQPQVEPPSLAPVPTLPTSKEMVLVSEEGEVDSPSANKETEEEEAMAEVESELGHKPLETVVPSRKRKHQVGGSDEEEEVETPEVVITGELRVSSPNKSDTAAATPSTLKTRLRSASKTPSKTEPMKKAKMEDRDVASKKIIPHLVIPGDFLLANDFGEVLERIKFQGWEQFLSTRVEADPDQIKEFYRSYQLNTGTTMVGTALAQGESLSFTTSKVGRLLGVTAEGFGEISEKSAEAMKAAKETSSQRLFKSKIPATHVSALTLPQRIAHHIIMKAVVPRQEKRNTITSTDLLLLDRFWNMEKINLPQVILQHMVKCSAKTHSLAYPNVIKLILQTEGVYKAADEVPMVTEIDMVNINKMQFQGDTNGNVSVSKILKREAGEGTSKSASVQSQMLSELKEIKSILSLLLEYFLNKDKAQKEDSET